MNTPGKSFLIARVPAFAALAWLLFTSITVFAQGQTGSVIGRVQNEVTGRYLNNALVKVKGTDIETLSDEAGRFRITNVPAGSATLEVFYTGLERQNVTINVIPSQEITTNVNLAPPGGAAVKLDAFVVASTKETDQANIAINEQRFAANIKTIVSTGDLSEHGDGNIAEFLKFVPGLSGTPGQRGDVGTLSVRGFPEEYTQITQDGADQANAPLSGNGREVSLRSTMSITNLARIEVTKVPTPSTGADTMAGSVNLVSKSAFEAPKQEFRYTATIAGEHDSIIDFFSGKKKYDLWSDGKSYFAFPAFTFTYTNPVTENFGFTISGKFHNAGLPTHERGKTYNYNSPTFNSSPQNPLYQSHLDNWWGQKQERRHLDASADWRITRNQSLSASARVFTSSSNNGIYRVSWNAGNVATPTVPGGIAGSFGPDFTIGATGRGNVQFQNNNQVQLYKGGGANLRYRFDNGAWKVDLKASQSTGNFRYRTTPEYDQMRNVTVTSNIPLRVEHHDIDRVFGPAKTLVYDNNNNLIDTSTAEFILNNTTVSTGTTLTFDVDDDVAVYNADVAKTIGWFRFPLTIQGGAAFKSKERDTYNRNNYVFTYQGPNGNNRTPAEFLSDPIPIFPGNDGQRQVIVSPYAAADAWKNNPSLFVELPANRVNREREKIQREENIKEDVSAFYFQSEARFLKNRLRGLLGVRFEKTDVTGIGALNTPEAVWQRTAAGDYVLNAAGQRVRRPEVGAANSIEELPFVWQARAARSERSYDGWYPSVHITYNWTEKLQSRLAWAQTYGRPNFSFIIPNVVVNEFTNTSGDVTGGRLTMRNPGLLPWTADNYDITTEYYTDHGGVFSAGVFRKEVDNFFADIDRPSTAQELNEVGINPGNEAWETRTTINSGSARIDGIELSFNQSLAFLDPWTAGWGKKFRVFGNVTKITIGGARTGDFQGFLPRSANWGVYFAHKRFRSSFRWNSQSDRPAAALTTIGPNGENYNAAQTHLDVNLSYAIRPNLSFFINMKNVRRARWSQNVRSDVLPEYAQVRYPTRGNGIGTEMGFQGTF